MPLLRVTHTKGAFTEAQRDELAEKLTHIMLVGETGADNEIGRSVAYLQFVELDAANGGWYVAGKREAVSPKGGRAIFDLYYPIGAASQAVKSEVHRAIEQTYGDVLGLDVTFPNRPHDWIFIHEIANGNWGISTQTVGVATIHAFMQGDPARRDFFLPYLAAERRVRDAFGYPEGSAGTGSESEAPQAVA